MAVTSLAPTCGWSQIILSHRLDRNRRNEKSISHENSDEGVLFSSRAENIFWRPRRLLRSLSDSVCVANPDVLKKRHRTQTRQHQIYQRISFLLLFSSLLRQSESWNVIPNTGATAKSAGVSKQTFHTKRHFSIRTLPQFATVSRSSDTEKYDEDTNDDDNNKDDEKWYQNMDVLQGGEEEWFGVDDSLEDWIPDAQKARPKPTHLTPAKEVLGEDATAKPQNQKDVSSSRRPSPYTEEEEELIELLGGKDRKDPKQSKREEGFLGDSTLKEIATDYSVPVCYLADVLCMWNVPPPINIHDRLGDLVTGEQAFALVEAVHSLDMGALHDRYSNQNLLQVCYEWNIDIKDAFEFAMKEGWSLPFGVRTNLRVEQEDELLRIYSPLFNDKDDYDAEEYND
ncbi:hypothetical protein IV203_012064 [Nitzschia inconspicua]|uniref:Uncharacterized protein n=1 Tax=Nitzschia inconspicua TaxID=303405 RepID=A0A9K3PJ01_9STRA|nr:hypothetical protein IV203_012064 [Nitzschia inconspicua]